MPHTTLPGREQARHQCGWRAGASPAAAGTPGVGVLAPRSQKGPGPRGPRSAATSPRHGRVPQRPPVLPLPTYPSRTRARPSARGAAYAAMTATRRCPLSAPLAASPVPAAALLRAFSRLPGECGRRTPRPRLNQGSGRSHPSRVTNGRRRGLCRATRQPRGWLRGRGCGRGGERRGACHVGVGGPVGVRGSAGGGTATQPCTVTHPLYAQSQGRPGAALAQVASTQPAVVRRGLMEP